MSYFSHTSSKIRRRAVTLLESMLLMVVLSIIVLGTGIAFQTLADIPKANNSALTVANLLVDKMEKLRALGFTTLSTTANGSETIVMNNVSYTRTWTITANPGSAYDANFLQLVVAIGNQNLTSAVCKQ